MSCTVILPQKLANEVTFLDLKVAYMESYCNHYICICVGYTVYFEININEL